MQKLKPTDADHGLVIPADEAQLNRIEKLIDGVPCSHPGCLNHVTHPCEGCGRIAGRTTRPCPFCGGQPKSWWDFTSSDSPNYNEGYNLECCVVHICKMDKHEAIEAWNKRA